MRRFAIVGVGLALLGCGGTERQNTSGSGGVQGHAGTRPGGMVSCDPGTERCPCYGNGTCNSGLACASMLCVNLGGSGGAGNATGAGGAPSTSGGSGNGSGGSGSGGAPSGGTGGNAGSGGPPCGSWMGGTSLGVCIPTGQTPPINELHWPADVCSSGFLCVATTKVTDPTSHFISCGPVLGGPGACWPAYIMEDIAAGTAVSFPQSSCPAGERCMGCTNPVNSLMFCND
jgi:hypothetical protein